MPITCEFEYHKPAGIKEAVRLLAEHKGGARVLAGGTDLIVRLKDAQDAPSAVVDIKGIAGLRGINETASSVRIGALATFAELCDNAAIKKHFPVLWEASGTVASAGVRNRATLAGNICSAVPSLDSAPALLVYNAVVEAEGPKGRREIPINKWFVGPKRTALASGEIVTGVLLEKPGRHGGAYVKLGRYGGEDLAQAGVAVLALPGNTYRTAFCALAPVPARAAAIERRLDGKKYSAALAAETRKLVASEISPITDIRASKEYRLRMARVMLARGLEAAVARLAGKGPRYGESLL